MSKKQELLQSIQQSWTQLTTSLNQMSGAQLTAVKDSQGWSVQDHLAHITTWEQSVQCVIEGKERYQGLGVDEAAYLSGDFDKMNDQIYKRHKNLPLKTVIDQFYAVHNQFLEQIEALSDADLAQPYRHYLPSDTKDVDDDRTLIDLVSGNTAGHYEEHLAWIERLVNG